MQRRNPPLSAPTCLALLVLALGTLKNPVVIMASPLVPGAWTEEITCRSDPEQRYALYLPAGYTAERAWPTLVVLDARGRALEAAERFQPAAERFGWVIASSYGTQSDAGWEPNQRALAAMLPDLESRVSLDQNRQVFAGFSGTARIAWALTLQAPGMVDGVIAASGGTADSRMPNDPFPVPIFLTAGERDFNLAELNRLAEALEDTGSTFRLETFDGRHAWMPEDLATEAMAWMELQAMDRGVRPVDSDLVRELLDRRIETAEQQKQADRPLKALATYRSALRDFPDLVSAETLVPVRQAAQELEESPELEQARIHATRLADREERFQFQVERAVRRIQREKPPPPAEKIADELDLGKLQTEAEDDSDPLRSAAASRMLAHVYTHMSFYLPRQLLEADQPWRALTALEIAHGIFDGLPRTWIGRARALTRLGRHQDAVEVLAEALERGMVDVGTLTEEPDFEPLREREDFQALTADEITS